MNNRISIILVLLFIIFSVKAQETAVDMLFNKTDNGYGIGDGFNGLVKAMIIQPDGKILAGGYFTTYNGKTVNGIVRINPNGAIDTTFNKGGTGLVGDVFTIALQSDGKILLGGIINTYNFYPSYNIVRLNNDGSYDFSFNTGTGANKQINAIAVQNDGKILVGGAFTTFNSTYLNKLTRLNSDGTIDNTFYNSYGYSGPDNAVSTIAIQSDNKLLIGGSFANYSQYKSYGIVRLKLNGTIDSAFNTGGAGTNSTVNSIAIQQNGSILLAGYFTTYNNITASHIVRLNADGSFDINFNIDGSGANNEIESIALQANNKIVIAGNFTTYNDSTVHNLVRINTDGSIDSTFNYHGVRPDDIVYTIAIQTDGNILAAGNFTKNNGMVVNHIIRLDSSGIKDKSFNAGTAFNNAVKVIAIQNDGKVLIGGDFSNYNGITCNYLSRLNIDGSIDSSFNYQGSGPDNTVSAFTLQSDHKM